MSVRALVLCAGRGTRLGELTDECPKPILPVANEPLVGHTLALLARHGLTDVTVNVHYRAAMVREALGDGSRFGVTITYLEEDELRGTAGTTADVAARERVADDILVVYGDLVFEHDLRALVERHRALEADATLVTHVREGPAKSIVDCDSDGRIVAFTERPEVWDREGPVRVSSGIQVLRRDFARSFDPRRPLDLPRDVYAPGAALHRFHAVPQRGYRIAVDSPERLRRASDDVLAGALND